MKVLRAQGVLRRWLGRTVAVAAAISLGAVTLAASPANAVPTPSAGDLGCAAGTSADGSWATSPQPAAAPVGVDIPVYFHNFSARPSEQVTYQQVLDQLNVLNHAFAGGQGGSATRFEFVLQAYENIPIRSSTVDVHSARGNRLKRQQHEGGKNALNVYLANRINYDGKTIQGFARPPWRVAERPGLDGIWIQRGVLPGVPGGPSYRADGDVLVHETGHWLGLYHVFRGYCSGAGDKVSDTGRMSEASVRSLRCRARDTCGGDGGSTDPIHNFMSRSGDACMTGFTGGQAVRMSNQWDRYRG